MALSNINLEIKEFNIPLFEWMDIIKVVKVSKIGNKRWMITDLQGNRLECMVTIISKALGAKKSKPKEEEVKYYKSYFHTKERAIVAWSNYHRLIAEDYINKNLPVAYSILEEYPDLQKKYKDRIFAEKYEERLKIWHDKLESITLENEESTKITGEDLAIRIY